MTSTQIPFSVHFVCRGNTYRSRLAAAYFYSLVDRRFNVTSSGIGASTCADVDTISPYARDVARQHSLTHGMTKRHTQTTNKLLADADVIVFMNKDVYDEATKTYDLDIRKCLVWHVRDIDKAAVRRAVGKDAEQEFLAEATATFKLIKHKCNELHNYLARAAWLDVMDAENKPIGMRLPISWITDRGLWHRGVHVVAQTIDGKYVVEKRSSNIVFSPGMLDVSLGGGVDAGEQPHAAAARETHEELGVRLPEKHFKPLFMYKQVGYHPHYRKQTKCHVYVYSVQLPVHSKDLHPQLSEVAEIRALSRRQVKRLLNKHRLRNFGKLSWSYKLYNRAIAYSSLPV